MVDGWASRMFNDDVVEKVNRLADVLDAISWHPLLGGNVALHGGTALNLFVMEPERLSLDLDLNYIAFEERDRMLSDQGRYVDALCDVGAELGFEPQAGRIGHAGCTIKLHYRSQVTGLPDFVKVDLDFLNRTCLLPAAEREMTFGGSGTRFLVNSPVEVAAGKLKAVTERTVPRDLFDLVRIGREREAWSTGDEVLDHRIAFYYATLSNRFPNRGDLADRSRFEGREADFRSILLPVLPAGCELTYDDLLNEAIPILEELTHPTDDAEREYADRLARGSLNADRLFDEWPDVAKRVALNPVALHKVEGIRTAIKRGIIDG